MRLVACLAVGAALVLAAPQAALGLGEVIREIRVKDNARTDEETIRGISGLKVGDTMELDTLEMARERLNTSGLFADVNVYWEAYRDGVRINIIVKDKFPWAPVPTFSYAPGNISAGLVIPHGNLFGRGKRGVIGGRISTADSGAVIAYQDPAVFQSWAYYQFSASMQDQTIPEYPNNPIYPSVPVRESSLRSYALSLRFGVAWWRRVRTGVGWYLEQTQVRWVRNNDMIYPGTTNLPPPTRGGRRGIISGDLTFDFRAREHAVTWGPALSVGFDRSAPRYGSDPQFKYWKLRGGVDHGIKFFRKHNLVMRAGGSVGRNLPFWSENGIGGGGLRGYNHRQAAGDTQFGATAEYHFPLFSLFKLDVRGLVFGDSALVYYSKLRPTTDDGSEYIERRDGRAFLPPEYLVPGFDRDRDVHWSGGAGLRFFLRSVSLPLVGLDFGYGRRDRTVRMLLVIGA